MFFLNPVSRSNYSGNKEKGKKLIVLIKHFLLQAVLLFSVKELWLTKRGRKKEIKLNPTISPLWTCTETCSRKWEALTELNILNSCLFICSIHSDRTSLASWFSARDEAAAVWGIWHPEPSKAAWGGHVKSESWQGSEVFLSPSRSSLQLYFKVWLACIYIYSIDIPLIQDTLQTLYMHRVVSKLTKWCIKSRKCFSLLFSSHAEVVQKNPLTNTKLDQNWLNVCAS